MRLIAIISIIILLSLSCSDKPTEIVRHEPVIQSITPERSIIYTNDTIKIQASVSDEDQDDKLTYAWSATGGSFISETNNPTQWHSPDNSGDYIITLTVSDGYYNRSKTTTIKVVNR